MFRKERTGWRVGWQGEAGERVREGLNSREGLAWGCEGNRQVGVGYGLGEKG